jgi:AcrR family transcriptional regulator
LEAALDCFTRLGFAATTMADIRRRSRASTGSIYHHFQSKEHLAAALYLEGVRDFQRGVQDALVRHRTAEKGVRAIIGFHLDWMAGNPEWARYLFFQMGQAELVTAIEADLRATNQAFLTAVRAWLQPMIEAGKIIRIPTELFAALAIGPTQEFARGWLRHGDAESLETGRRVLSSAAWNALRSDRA